MILVALWGRVASLSQPRVRRGSRCLALGTMVLGAYYVSCQGDVHRQDSGGISGGAAGDLHQGLAEGGGGVGGDVEMTDGARPLQGLPCTGYTLVGSPENDAGVDFEAMLLDMDGAVVHTWGLTGFPPKLLSSGDLIGCTGVHPGGYDCVELQQVSWEGNLKWSFSAWEVGGGVMGARHHHDFFRGNRQLGYYAPGGDFSGAGSTFVLAHSMREAPELREGLIDDDAIYEVNEDGSLGEFVWHAADHYEQFGFDERALEDIRDRLPEARIEFLHGNSVTPLGPNHWYDEGYQEFHPDNIMYSSRSAAFVAIIERSTGEVVWRIGPDYADGPEAKLGQASGQHHPHMIPAGLPGAGNILLYDNGGPSGYGGAEVGDFRFSRKHSRVIEFNPLTFDIVWQYGEADGPEFFFSPYVGSVQRLPNGNTLITVGTAGRVIEVTPEKEIVWEYQYSPEVTEPHNRNWIYRALRVPPEWVEAVNSSGANYESWKSLFE